MATGALRRLGVVLAIGVAGGSGGAVIGCAPAAQPRASEAAASIATPADHRPRIVLVHGTGSEQATRRQLERLFDQFDLSPWLFTRSVQIDDDAIPHSHPVLTLSTRHVRDDLLLLSTYVHEQSHWYFEARSVEARAASAELEAKLPGLPVGFPDGAVDHDSSYEHVGVNAFEYQAMRRLVGELQARTVFEFWATDHYRAIYRTVVDHFGPILRVLASHGLVPPSGAAR